MFSLFTISHNTLSSELKSEQERILNTFSIQDDADKLKFLGKLRQATQESFVISTCNRTLVGYWDLHAREKAGNVYNLLCDHVGAQPEEYKQYFKFHTGLNAVEHLFRVSTGLESKILGESNITYQLLGDLKLAKGTNNVSVNIMKIGDFIKSSVLPKVEQTPFREGSVSEVHKIATFIKSHLPNDNNSFMWDGELTNNDYLIGNVPEDSKALTPIRPKLLVVGTGKFAQEQVEKLKVLLSYYKDKPEDILFYSKTPGRAREVAEKHGTGYAEGELTDVLKSAEHVIFATDAKQPILKISDVEQNLPFRQLKIFDLSQPSACENGIGQLPNIEMHRLFEIQEAVNSDLIKREIIKPEISKIVHELVKDYTKIIPSSKLCLTCYDTTKQPQQHAEQMLCARA